MLTQLDEHSWDHYKAINRSHTRGIITTLLEKDMKPWVRYVQRFADNAARASFYLPDAILPPRPSSQLPGLPLLHRSWRPHQCGTWGRHRGLSLSCTGGPTRAERPRAKRSSAGSSIVPGHAASATGARSSTANPKAAAAATAASAGAAEGAARGAAVEAPPGGAAGDAPASPAPAKKKKRAKTNGGGGDNGDHTTADGDADGAGDDE